jgi:hypothetical protein
MMLVHHGITRSLLFTAIVKSKLHRMNFILKKPATAITKGESNAGLD